VVTMLANPLSPDAVPEIRDVQIAAQANGVELKMYNASTRTELDAAFSAIAAQRPDALLVGSDPFYVVRRDDLIAFAARYKIPAIYPFREFADAGGLITTTKRILQTLAVKPAFTLVRFSKERNLRGFPSCGQLRSKWS